MVAASATAGSNACAHTRYPSADGWKPSGQNVPASARNTAPVRAARPTGTPSAARTAVSWARASRRPRHPMSWRRGAANARAAPRSGQVPTTTATPAARSRRTAAARCSGAPRDGPNRVASLAPTRITATSGRVPTRARATCVPRSEETEPETATLESSTRRPPGPSASSAASWPPTVSDTRSTPTPSAVESPSSTSRNGGALPGPAVERMARPMSGLAYRRVRAAIAWPARTAAPPMVPAMAVTAKARARRRIELIGYSPVDGNASCSKSTCEPLTEGSTGCSVRRDTRVRSCAHRPAGPTSVPATRTPLTSVPGRSTASIAADAAGHRGHHGGQYGRRGCRVAGGRRVEPVVAEHARRVGRERGAEQVTEGDGAPARLDHRHRLRGGQLTRPAAGQPAQRWLDGFDRAEVVVGTCPDLGTVEPIQPPHRLDQVAHG